VVLLVIGDFLKGDIYTTHQVFRTVKTRISALHVDSGVGYGLTNL